MNRRDLYLIVFSTMACTAAGIAAFWLGWRFDAVGHGLNPLIAYPLGTLLLIAPLAALTTSEE